MRERDGGRTEVTCSRGSARKESGREQVQPPGPRWPAQQGTRTRSLLPSMAWSMRFLDYGRDGRPRERLRRVPRHKLGRSMPMRGVLLVLLCVVMCGGLVASAQQEASCCVGDDLDCSASSVEHQGQVSPAIPVHVLVGLVCCLGWSSLSIVERPSTPP